MDITMPHIDGIEATKQIKLMTPQIRIIGLTMHDEPAIVNSTLSAGAEQCLTKGGTFEELIQAITFPPIQKS